MMRLHLVRHGECERPPGGGMLGQCDVPLTDAGRRQAIAAATRLRGVPFVAAYSSDLRRCVDTARTVLDGRPLELRIDPRLREVDVGRWEGLEWEAIESRFENALAVYTSPGPGFAFPDGESLEAVAARASEALDTIRRQVEEGEVLLVAHHGLLAILLTLVLGMPEWEWRRFAMGHGSITTIEFHGDAPLLTGLNDRSHLAEHGDGAR